MTLDFAYSRQGRLFNSTNFYPHPILKHYNIRPYVQVCVLHPNSTRNMHDRGLACVSLDRAVYKCHRTISLAVAEPLNVQPWREKKKKEEEDADTETEHVLFRPVFTDDTRKEG